MVCRVHSPWAACRRPSRPTLRCPTRSTTWQHRPRTRPSSTIWLESILRPSATSSSCSTCAHPRPATWTGASAASIPSCRRWSGMRLRRPIGPPSLRPKARGARPADLLATFESLPGPAVVVIQDLDEPPAAACFGDVSCSSYLAFGARGVVTSGGGSRPGAGPGPELPGVHRRDDLLARVQLPGGHRHPRAGRRDHGTPRRSDPWRPQRRRDHPGGDRHPGGRAGRRIRGG